MFIPKKTNIIDLSIHEFYVGYDKCGRDGPLFSNFNKKIVLFFRVTNWLSTVKNSEIAIINFPRKRYHFENTFLDHLSLLRARWATSFLHV
jgi:hypothetical protein